MMLSTSTVSGFASSVAPSGKGKVSVFVSLYVSYFNKSESVHNILHSFKSCPKVNPR